MTNDERLALAHAIRTPLTSALLSTGLLSTSTLTAAQRELVQRLEEDLLRLRLLVERGLDITHAGSHAGPMERTPTLLSELVERIAHPLVEQARERGVDVESAVVRDAAVLADPVKLGWAVSALLGNAIRFARTHVEVTVRIAPQEPPKAGRSEDVQLLVHDDGPGMDPETSDRLFSRDGAGLGLFLVREIVHAHGGEVELLATSPAGTTFAVRLPIHGESHAQAR